MVAPGTLGAVRMQVCHGRTLGFRFSPELEKLTFSSDDLKPSKELGVLLRTFAGLNRGMTWSFVFRQDAMAMMQGADAAVHRRRAAAEAAISPRVRDVL